MSGCHRLRGRAVAAAENHWRSRLFTTSPMSLQAMAVSRLRYIATSLQASPHLHTYRGSPAPEARPPHMRFSCGNLIAQKCNMRQNDCGNHARSYSSTDSPRQSSDRAPEARPQHRRSSCGEMIAGNLGIHSGLTHRGSPETGRRRRGRRTGGSAERPPPGGPCAATTPRCTAPHPPAARPACAV